MFDFDLVMYNKYNLKWDAKFEYKNPVLVHQCLIVLVVNDLFFKILYCVQYKNW